MLPFTITELTEDCVRYAWTDDEGAEQRSELPWPVAGMWLNTKITRGGEVVYYSTQQPADDAPAEEPASTGGSEPTD